MNKLMPLKSHTEAPRRTLKTCLMIKQLHIPLQHRVGALFYQSIMIISQDKLDFIFKSQIRMPSIAEAITQYAFTLNWL